MFMGSAARRSTAIRSRCSRRPAAPTTPRPPRTARTTTSTCRRTRWSWRCSSSRTAWATCSTRCRPRPSTRQRDVVKNERRQSYENAPYGMASIEIDEMLYPQGHPYSLADDRLHGGSHRRQLRGRRRVLQDVLPAGQRQPGDRRRHRLRRRRARRSRSGSPTSSRARRRSGRSTIRTPMLTRGQEEDDPGSRAAAAALSDLDHAGASSRRATPSSTCVSLLLAGGKNSRLYKRLVYDLQIAQDVTAFQASKALELRVPDHRDGAAPAPSIDRDPRASSTRRSRTAAEGAAERRASSAARSTRSSRRSTTAWSASAASAASAIR